MNDLTPAEHALADLAVSLELAACCEHLYESGTPALVACIRCELPKLVGRAGGT